MAFPVTDKDVGFALETDPDAEHAAAVAETRKLFLALAAFLGLLVPFVITVKYGAFMSERLEPVQPGLVVRALPKWDAEIIGTLQLDEVPVSAAGGWNEGMPMPPSAKDMKAEAEAMKKAGKSASMPKRSKAEKRAEIAKIEARLKALDKTRTDEREALLAKLEAMKAAVDKTMAVVTDKPDWIRLEEVPVRFETMVEHMHHGKTVMEKETVVRARNGWVPASAVKSVPHGPAGAIARKLPTLRIFWGIAGVLAVAGLLFAPLLVPFFHFWMAKVVAPLGAFNTKVLLSGVFFGLMAPIGFVRRLGGYDPLSMKVSSDSPSFWVDKAPLDREHFDKQF